MPELAPSDPVNPHVDTYAWTPSGWEDAAEGTVSDASTTTRGAAAAWFARFSLGEDITGARCWKRYVRPLTRGEVWEDYGRERWEDRHDLGNDEGPESPPAEWDPDEWDPVWQFVHRDHEDAVAVWVCGARGDKPPHNPKKAVD